MGYQKQFFFGPPFPEYDGPCLSVALRLENYITEEKEEKKYQSEGGRDVGGFFFCPWRYALRFYINGMERHLSESVEDHGKILQRKRISQSLKNPLKHLQKLRKHTHT